MKIKLAGAVVDTDFVKFMNKEEKEVWIYLSNGRRIVVPCHSENQLLFIRDTLFKDDKIDLSSYKYEYLDKSYSKKLDDIWQEVNLCY